ncbi:MAG: hypothetical protein ABI193_20450, partial [Minicystis sp.]
KAPRFQISGRLSTTAHFHDADPESKSLVLDPSVLVAKDIAVTRGNRTHGGGTLRVDVTGGRLDHGVPRDLALTLAARAPDLAWLDWHNPPAGDPRLTALTASLNAKIKIPWPASLLDGTKEEAAITGSLALSGTGDARFKGTTLRGDVDATAELQRLDLGRAQLELRALRAVTRDLTVYRKGPPTRGWWSRFDGSRLDVDTKTGLRLDLRGAVRCKDGAPFNAILASEGVIPGWVGTLFPMKGLTASGELRRSHEKLDLGLRARGSSAEVTVRLHDIGKAMSGAVKVETKLVSIGVGFREGKSDVKVLAGEEWLKARISEANAKEAEDQSTTPASTGTAR